MLLLYGRPDLQDVTAIIVVHILQRASTLISHLICDRRKVALAVVLGRRRVRSPAAKARAPKTFLNTPGNPGPTTGRPGKLCFYLVYVQVVEYGRTRELIAGRAILLLYRFAYFFRARALKHDPCVYTIISERRKKKSYFFFFSLSLLVLFLCSYNIYILYAAHRLTTCGDYYYYYIYIDSSAAAAYILLYYTRDRIYIMG